MDQKILTEIRDNLDHVNKGLNNVHTNVNNMRIEMNSMVGSLPCKMEQPKHKGWVIPTAVLGVMIVLVVLAYAMP